MPVDRAALAIVAGVALLAGAAPDDSQRHPVAGHFNVPKLPSPAPTATGVANLITNPGFETGKVDDGWYQCGDSDAYVITEHPHAGGYDQYSGTLSGTGEPEGNAGVCQAVRIPPGAILTAQLYQLSNESDTTFAYQEADLLDEHGNVVVTLYKTVNNKAAWVQGTWNLDAYAGKIYWLYFGVHGDGYQKLSTQQFLDDVALTGNSSPGHE